MEYSNQDQQLQDSYYYPPMQQHPQYPHPPPQSYDPSSTNRPSPPPTPLITAPLMSVPESYPSSHGSGSYEAQLQAHRSGEASSSRSTVSPGEAQIGPNGKPVRRIGGKANVSSACGPCKKAHLACDVQRPCKRCTNMGKEDQCEDVPHKKRGRPKVNKTSPNSQPRARPSHDDPMRQYRQQLPPYPDGPPGNYDPSFHPHQDYRAYYQPAPPPAQARIPSPQMAGSDPPNLFTMFTTTDFRIMRVTHESWMLTGYQEPDFVGHSLLDWVNAAERSILDEERIRLLTLNNSTMVPNSNYEYLQQSIQHLSERELVSPAEGMGDRYPNQNVRIIRSNQQFSLFNVRLHLGGGLGGSVFRPESYDRIYLVVSCLYIPEPIPAPLPQSRAVSSGTIASSYGPPTPITPMTAGPPGGLPGFSSIAAGVEAPPPAMAQTTRYTAGPYNPYFASRPGSQHQQPPPPGPAGPYVRPNSTQPMATYQIPPTTAYAKSPSQELQTPYTPYDYPQQQQGQGQQVPLNDQAYYPDYREDQWNRHATDASLQQPPPPLDTSSSSSSNPPLPPNDYSRRPWET